MSAWELKRDHLTRYCLFGIDSSEDLAMLPTSVKVGSGDLIRSTTCAIGSIARASDGSQYILTGDNEWIGYDAGGGGLVMYECQEGEYDAETGVPTIEEPNESTIYLVPTGDSAAPYRGWIYINDEWAQFAGGGGGGTGAQSDWNQTDTTAEDYIKNKPTIPAAQIQSDWNQTNTAALDYVKNKPEIGTEIVRLI
jgi:hypothetical protein